jgi:hypothetical protein
LDLNWKLDKNFQALSPEEKKHPVTPRHPMSEVTQSIQNAPTLLTSTLAQIEPTFALTRDFLATPIKALADKVQSIWQTIVPYLVSFAQFATSQLGVSLELLGIAFVPLQMARAIDNKILSTALIAAGILIAGAGGYFLCSSGAISAAISNLMGTAAST